MTHYLSPAEYRRYKILHALFVLPSFLVAISLGAWATVASSLLAGYPGARVITGAVTAFAAFALWVTWATVRPLLEPGAETDGE